MRDQVKLQNDMKGGLFITLFCGAALAFSLYCGTVTNFFAFMNRQVYWFGNILFVFCILVGLFIFIAAWATKRASVLSAPSTAPPPSGDAPADRP